MPIRMTRTPSITKSMPGTSDARVMFFTFHLFGLGIYLTLSVARDIVTKSFENTSRDIPNRDSTML